MIKTVLLHKPKEVTLDVHQVMPSLSNEDFEGLLEDIRLNGIHTPILLDANYNVINGHNRIHCWKVLLEEGVDIGPVAAVVHPKMDKWRVMQMALSANTSGRKLSFEQKKDLARDLLWALAHKYEAEGYVKSGERRSWTNSRIAHLSGTTRDTVKGLRTHMESMGFIPRADKLIFEARHRTSGKVHEVTVDRDNVEQRPQRLNESKAGLDFQVETSLNGSNELVENGALEQLAEAGFVLPELPRGRTHEEKVYSILASFRDQLKANPSDPKAVARAIADQPMQVVATVEDFGELNRWLTAFHTELVNIMEEVQSRAS